jgi:hypothetical protein
MILDKAMKHLEHFDEMDSHSTIADDDVLTSPMTKTDSDSKEDPEESMAQAMV